MKTNRLTNKRVEQQVTKLHMLCRAVKYEAGGQWFTSVNLFGGATSEVVAGLYADFMLRWNSELINKAKLPEFLEDALKTHVEMYDNIPKK